MCFSIEFGLCDCIYGMVWRNGVIDIREMIYWWSETQCAGGGHLVAVGTSAIMVQEVWMITPTIGDGGKKKVIIHAFELQKVPIFAKHDVKAMVQQVDVSHTDTTMCGSFSF